jgi:hypothetical protein
MRLSRRFTAAVDRWMRSPSSLCDMRLLALDQLQQAKVLGIERGHGGV